MAITLNNDNNVGNVKFLRNGALYANHDAALSAISNFPITNEQDGTAVLARYSGDSATDVKTIVGWIYVSGTTKTITIQDTEGASQDLIDYLGTGVTKSNNATSQLEALSGGTFTPGTSSSADTSVEGAKAYAKDYTDEQIGELEYTGVTTGDGKVIVNVTETDGKVSGYTAEVGGLKLTDYTKGSDSGAVENTDTINQAISKLEKQVDAVNDTIEALDYTDTAVTKQFIAKVDENNGVISVERGELQSSGKTIVITADGNNVNFEANIDGETIVKDSDGVLSVASAALTQYVGDEKTIHISSADTTTNTKTVSSLLTISATTASEANVKEQYNLVNASGETIGATIKIYKDSALLSVALLHAITTENPQVLPTYNKATNTWTDIDATAQTQANQALCYAYEDVSGNTVVAAVPVGSFINEQEFASGVTWDATANKVRGVVDPNSESFLTVGADGFKISGVSGLVTSAIEDLDATVSNSGTSGHVGVEVVETDGKLVSVSVTTDDIASADDLEELSGKTITEVESSNSSISAVTAATTDGTVEVDLTTDASKIKMTGFTADESGFTTITSASTVTEAVKAIETAFIESEGALAELEEKIDTVSGDVETISGKVDTIEENYISGVSVNGSAVTVANHVAPISISAATTSLTSQGNNAIVVDTDASGNITLGLNYIDCGTYDNE